MISSAAGGVPLLMVRHPAGPSASLLAFGGRGLFSDHAFVVVRQVSPFSFCVGESVAFALNGLGHPPPRRGELLEYNLEPPRLMGWAARISPVRRGLEK